MLLKKPTALKRIDTVCVVLITVLPRYTAWGGIYCRYMSDQRILTGLQPTGALHIGNYLGSVRQMVDLQDDGEMFFFIADLHALTHLHSVSDAYAAREQEASSRHLLAASIALGIDPKKSIVYRQSDFPQIAEMAWIFSCMLNHNFLTIGHAYKDAVQNDAETGLGVFLYPVLMAADILIADAEVVPIGKDQVQHVEIAREIARRFNHIVGQEYFTEPQERIQEATATLPGTDGKKMSKSKGNTLPIFEDEDRLRERVMGIVTDSTPKGEPIDTEACLVCTYLEIVMPQEEYRGIVDRCRAGSITYKELKDLLVEQYVQYFKEPRETYQAIIEDTKHLEKVLGRSRKKLDSLFTERLHGMKQGLGLL